MDGTRNLLTAPNHAKTERWKGIQFLLCQPIASLGCVEKMDSKKAVEHTMLEKKMGFRHCMVLGESTHAMVTARPDVAHSITVPCKFSSAPSECHHQSLKGLTKHLL